MQDRKPTILAVDDKAENLDILSALLEDYDVRDVTDGASALQLCISNTYVRSVLHANKYRLTHDKYNMLSGINEKNLLIGPFHKNRSYVPDTWLLRAQTSTFICFENDV